MFLKIKDDENNKWVLFDGADQISVEVIGRNSIKQRIDDMSVFVSPYKDTSDVAEIILSKNGVAFKQIIAEKPVYVLNKEGKTIDRF